MPNALVDVVLLVGMDDNTALVPLEKPEDHILSCLFSIEYDPPVLSTITATEMVNLFPFPHIDAKYPPIYEDQRTPQGQGHAFFQRERLMSDQLASKAQTYPAKRSYSVHPRFHAGQTLRLSSAATKPELPISEELQRSIPSLCFPDGAQVYRYREKPETMVHFLVLTDMNAGKTYATCLTFYRTYIIEKDDQGNIYMNLDNQGKESTDPIAKQCHVPQCCVMISKYPYFTRVKECLSRMLTYIEEDPEEMSTFLKEFAHILTHTPVPPAGTVSVEFNLHGMAVTLMPSDHPDKQVIDVPLHLTFLCFPTEELLKILSCVLLEERVVFLSSNYALLTIIAESVRHFILPFKSRYTYSPILPSNRIGYLQAPGIFMFGCHSRHRQEAEQVEGLVLVDIDGKTVTVNANFNSDEDDVSVPSLPTQAATIFKEKCSKLRLQFEFEQTQRPFCYNMEQMRQQQAEFVKKQNEHISHACLELMVNLFRGVVFDMRVDLKHFNKDAFLVKQSEHDRPFYSRVFKTDMFKSFLEERITEKSDYWSDLEMKTRRELESYTQSRVTSGPLSTRRSSVNLSAISLMPPVVKREIIPFQLSDMTDIDNYVRTSVSTLNKDIQHWPDYDQRTSFVYLRSLFHVASGNKLAAMDDFIRLTTSNIRILPQELLQTVYQSLTEEETVLLKKKVGHEKLLEMVEALEAEEGEHPGKKIRMDPIKIPDRNIEKEEFIDLVSLMDLSNDYDTISHLFEALTRSKTSYYVEQGKFQLFVERWHENQQQCNSVKIVNGTLSDEETILKISIQIKTDSGIGRIGLTDKRLFFLKDVSNLYQEIVKLRDIRGIDKSQHQGFLSQATDTLIIKRKEGKPFTVYMKEDRNWWYLVIMEMWAGKLIAEATRDINAVSQAVQNTLLIDALIACGQQEDTPHHNHIEDWAEKLAFYSQAKRDGKHKLPKDTKEALQHKIDPNMREKERKTVQALLYTGGEDSQHPHLWCGLSDGKIKVYSAITWMLENECVHSKSNVACLKAVGNGQVWAGTLACIYVIDSETITCNKKLSDHVDLVVDIVLYDQGRWAFTAGLDGTIIKWDVKKLCNLQQMQLEDCKGLRAMKIYEDKLFCSTWNAILMTDLNGKLLHAFKYKVDNKLIELDSFSVLPNNEIWAGCRREGKVVIWNLDRPDTQDVVTVSCQGISAMSLVKHRLWIGTKKGKILIYTIATRTLWKDLAAHEDAVRVLFFVERRYVISGGGSKDGKIAIWSATANTTDSGNHMEITSSYS